jgi:hypothetical protein
VLLDIFFKGAYVMRRLPYLIFATLLIFCSCTKHQGEEFFPQGNDGSQWDYSVLISTPSGNQSENMSIRIEGKETINGKVYYRQVTSLSGKTGTENKISYNRRAKEGIYRITGDKKDDTEHLGTPFPITIGKTWLVQTPNGQIRYLAEKYETVELLGRQYPDCLKISFRNEDQNKKMEGFSYFASGIGEISTNMKIDENSVQYVLKKYKLTK